jgi:hypothetical protein
MPVYSVVAGNRAIFSGTSSDTKPTNAITPGSLFVETDTLKQYIFSNAGTWQPYVDVAAAYIWQPSTLSYIPANADASGNLNVSSSGGGGGAVTVTSGNVTVNQSNAANLQATVTGSVNVGNFPATQPVSGSVSVSNFPATQPVSGTVAATQSGTWTTDRTWSLASGTDSVTATISGTPSVSVSNFPATQAVSGSVSVSNFPATQPVSGTVAATQSGTWNIGSITTLPAITGSVSVSNFPATQAVSGTVAVSSSALPTNAAQEYAGQLQRVADFLELLLIEHRVTNVLLSNLSQPRSDNPELIRSDLINSLQ